MKKLLSFFEGINGVLLIIYVSLILGAYAFTVNGLIPRVLFQKIFFIIIGCIILCPITIKILKKIKINQVYPDSEKERKYWKILFFIIPFTIFLVYYIIYYPGGFTYDNVNQYEQAVNNSYSDWHPYLHTLIVIKLPLLITGGWTGSVVLFQILCFSIAICYASYTIYIYTNNKYAILFLSFILLNPRTNNLAMIPWKDVSFAICTIVLMTYVVRIYFTNGEWIEKLKNSVILVLILSITTLFRHNAILFTIPYLFAIMFFCSKKKYIQIVLSFVFIIAFVRFPMFSLFNVEKAKNRQIESLGLPMTVIGGAITYDEKSLDEDTKMFAYKVASKEVWNKKYYYGQFNYVKRDKNTNLMVIEEYGYKKIINMMINCFRNAPYASLMGFIKLTEPVYSITYYKDYFLYPYVDTNEYNIVEKGIPILQKLNHKYMDFCSIVLPYLFRYVGVMHLIIIAFILAKCKLNSFLDWRKVFFAIPIFVYNFGTMFLLTGVDDCTRFFYYTFPVTPILLVIFLVNTEEGGTELIVRK